MYLSDGAKLHFTKANLVSGMVTMRICEREVVRYVHVLFCFVVLVLRAGLMYVAFSIRGRLFHFNAFLHDYVTVLAFYLIASSSAYMALTVVGICAAVTYRRRLFITYSSVLAVLYMTEIVIFGIAFNMWLNLNATVEETMDHHISNYDTNPHDIDYVQEELRCCGKYREDEWFDAIAYIPASCCPSRPPTHTEEFCSILPPDISYIIHNTGCLRKLQELPRTGLAIVTSVLIVLCGVEVLSFCVSTYASRGTRTALSIKNTNIMKAYEAAKKSTKDTNIYIEKQNNLRKVDASCKCSALSLNARSDFPCTHSSNIRFLNITNHTKV